MNDDDTTQLLKEIRDILAAQERKYEKHLEDVKQAYVQQIKMGETERKNATRNVFWLIILLAALIGLMLYLLK